MIFVTVGTQGPFDRLVRTVDSWAGGVAREDVFAQIGPSEYEPQSIRFVQSLEPDEFRQLIREASVVISHAGIGTILQVSEAGVPAIVMPRRVALGEQRNDHQWATANRLAELGLVTVARDESDLLGVLAEVDDLSTGRSDASDRRDQLISRLRAFIQGHGESE